MSLSQSGSAMNEKGYGPAFLAGLATLIVFLPCLKNGFIFLDDSGYIYNNQHLASSGADFIRWAFLDFYAGFWIPLTWVSFELDYLMYGFNPLGYHLTNVVLHCCNTVLFSLVTLRLIRLYYDRKGDGLRDKVFDNTPAKMSGSMTGAVALLAGLLFGLHPLRVESVGWVAERKDVLNAVFALSSLLVYTDYALRRTEGKLSCRVFTDRRYIVALLLFVMSLMSKPVTVTLPLVFLILDWFPLERLGTTKKLYEAVMEKLPFFLCSLVIAWITIVASSSGIAGFDELRLRPRILLAVKSVITYLRMMLLPVGLSPMYDHPENAASLMKAQYIAPMVLFFLISAAVSIAGRKNRLWPAVWLYYLVTVFPMLGITQIGPQGWADRFTYLPSMGPTILAALGLVLVCTNTSDGFFSAPLLRYTAIAAVALLPVYYSLLTARLIPVWHDTESVWNRAVEEYRGEAGVAHFNRGFYYNESGDYEAALKDMNASLDIFKRRGSLRICRVYYGRGLVYQNMRRYGEAVAEFTKAVESAGARPQRSYYFQRGLAFHNLGMEEEAEKDFEIARGLAGR